MRAGPRPHGRRFRLASRPPGLDRVDEVRRRHWRNSADEARDLADGKMTRYPLSTPDLMPNSPVDPGSGSYDGKGWEVNSITDENGDSEYY